MDFDLTEDQVSIQKAVRNLAAGFGDDYWARLDREHEFPWDFYRVFADAGWVGMSLPEQYGGGGQGIAEAGLLVEEIAASGAAMNGCSALHLGLFGMNIVTKHGSEQLREAVLPAVATGELHVCFAVTEPDAGTDTTRIRTFARRDGDGYVISGRKVWITKAAQSQKMILVTRTAAREDGARTTDGMTVFLVDVDDPAIRLTPIPKLGRNAVTSYEVAIDNLRVPANRVIGQPGDGFRVLLDGLNPERILLAHESLGIGRAALQHAVKYANEREVFGRPIGQNQGLAFPLAQACAQLDAAELVARKAAWLYDHGRPCGREANTAKLLAADAAFYAADRAMQTLGGMGYALEFPVQRYFREARLMRIAPISQEMVLAYIAQQVLGLPRSY
jgi:acyl-CoA dehydrogenase